MCMKHFYFNELYLNMTEKTEVALASIKGGQPIVPRFFSVYNDETISEKMLRSPGI